MQGLFTTFIKDLIVCLADKEMEKKMEKMYGKFYILDGEVKKVEDCDTRQVDKSIYEVIRLRKGVFSFFEEHYLRFSQGLAKKGLPKIDKAALKTYLEILVEVNEVDNHNTKIIYEQQGDKFHLYAFLSKSNFPSDEDFEKGVKATLLEVEREDPNIKSIRSAYVKMLDEKLEKNGAFEAIIVNKDHMVTEGGRSNIFMIKEDKLITPPAENVLIGIIRTKVFEIAKNLSIDIEERLIPLEELMEADTVFFTGTGKDILPIASIDGRLFSSGKNKLLRKIIQEFNILANK